MAALIETFNYLAVLLRAVCLSMEFLLIGGSIFYAWALRSEDGEPANRAVFGYRILWGAALGLVAAQSLWLSIDAAILRSTTGMIWRDALGADFFIAGLMAIAGGATIAIVSMSSRTYRAKLLLPANLLLLASSVMTSHSAARLDHRLVLMAITSSHQLGAAIWIGSLPFFLWSLVHTGARESRAQMATTYSRQAITGVVLLAGSGLILSFAYIRSFTLLYGTAYGVMTVTKCVLLGLALLLGFRNNRIIRNKVVDGEWRLRMRRFTEAEIGIGFTAIFAAASLASQPPAIDMQANRVDASSIIARFTPKIPLMKTPELTELSPVTPINAEEERAFGKSPLDTYVPGVGPIQTDTLADFEWSEYNHHWAGLVVLVAGMLALLSKSRGGRWARHWPLVFIGLAIFLLLRADSENWPLGPHGFWEGFAFAEVAQHRFFVLLITLFAVFQWAVETGRVRSQYAALVFPLVSATGGLLLLAHNHALANFKDELLVELSHTPIAILGVTAGWARWLEVRLPGRIPRWAENVWPVCFIVIGCVLINYREH